MKTTIKNYTNQELLDRVSSLQSFKEYPKGYWNVIIRAKDYKYNKFNDKNYLFYGERFIMVTSATSHSGSYGMMNFMKWNKKGFAVIKSDEIYYDVYEKSDGKRIRHHNGKMECLRQVGDVKYYRDGIADKVVDEYGKLYTGNISANYHCNSYTQKTGVISWLINGWSTACQCLNNLTDYYTILGLIPLRHKVTHCILKEF